MPLENGLCLPIKARDGEKTDVVVVAKAMRAFAVGCGRGGVYKKELYLLADFFFLLPGRD